jgi:hypothetical protein
VCENNKCRSSVGIQDSGEVQQAESADRRQFIQRIEVEQNIQGTALRREGRKGKGRGSWMVKLGAARRGKLTTRPRAHHVGLDIRTTWTDLLKRTKRALQFHTLPRTVASSRRTSVTYGDTSEPCKLSFCALMEWGDAHLLCTPNMGAGACRPKHSRELRRLCICISRV